MTNKDQDYDKMAKSVLENMYKLNQEDQSKLIYQLSRDKWIIVGWSNKIDIENILDEKISEDQFNGFLNHISKCDNGDDHDDLIAEWWEDYNVG